MSDFTYKGISARSMGVRIQSKKRPLLPNIRQEYEDIPGRHGSYSFSDGTLEDITIEIECWVKADSRDDLRYRARQIAAWLYSKDKQRLIFDDEPDLYYYGRIANQIDLETLIRFGKFTLQFRCDPFSYLIENASELILDSDITLNRDIRVDDKYSFVVTSPVTVEVNNFGTAEVYPLLQVTGSFTTLSVTANGKTLQYTESLTNQTLEIDGERMTSKVGTLNKLNKISGAFLELVPGINSVQIGGTGLNCTVSFLFAPRFI
ncbi:distal tail protein Dit [Aneurinibacillus thermoaerophilus]|uniref:distal tail protein Dit n=1 Tax=Aneurinibacillus thermoaerophilus TaxID=143495 RepID=UPI002E1D7218|nr:distal tail protein Dit [Aneurinibacillus thermoaerophilus]MED0676993.1 phage tail family protein [Aneurinibacillus thermoaerophilus]